jgi:hypothetical protein
LGGGLIVICLGIGAYCWYKKQKSRVATKVIYLNHETPNPQISAIRELKSPDNKSRTDVSGLQDFSPVSPKSVEFA